MNRTEIIDTLCNILNSCKKHARLGLMPGIVDLETGTRYGEDLREKELLTENEYSLLSSAEYGRACERLGYILINENRSCEASQWLKEANKTKQSLALMTNNLFEHPNTIGKADQYSKLDDSIMKNVARWLVEDNVNIVKSIASRQHADGGFPIRFKPFQYEDGKTGPGDRANGKDGEGRYACQALIAGGLHEEARQWAEWSLSVQHPNAGWAERFDSNGVPIKARGWEPGIIQSGFMEGKTALSVIATVHHIIALIEVHDQSCLEVHKDLKKRIREAVRRAMIFVTRSQRDDGKWNRFFVCENRQYIPVYIGKSQTSYASPQEVADANDEPPGQVYRRTEEGVIKDQWHNDYSSHVSDYYYSFRIDALFNPINAWLNGEVFEYPEQDNIQTEKTIQSNLDRFYNKETGLFHQLADKPQVVKFVPMLQTINKHFLRYLES